MYFDNKLPGVSIPTSNKDLSPNERIILYHKVFVGYNEELFKLLQEAETTRKTMVICMKEIKKASEEIGEE